MDKGTQFRQGDAFTKEALLPEMDVAADNASGSFLINRRIAVTDAADPGSCFIGDDDRVLVRSFNAGIRDYGRKQQRVCTTTLRALYPADLGGGRCLCGNSHVWSGRRNGRMNRSDGETGGCL